MAGVALLSGASKGLVGVSGMDATREDDGEGMALLKL